MRTDTGNSILKDLFNGFIGFSFPLRDFPASYTYYTESFLNISISMGKHKLNTYSLLQENGVVLLVIILLSLQHYHNKNRQLKMAELLSLRHILNFRAWEE